MPRLTTIDKLAILADAAKYDASCASSSARRKDSRTSGGIGSTGGAGIGHCYAPDGRCISLLTLRPFVVARGWQPGPLLDSPALTGLLAPPPRQQSLPL